MLITKAQAQDAPLPSTTIRSTLTRQWELLKLLPSRAPGISATELQGRLSDAGYSISKRTVERDLIDLSQIFPLQCNDKGVPYGWYWTPGSSAELPGVTLGKALTLRLVEESIRPLMPAFMLQSLKPRFDQARKKLEALSDVTPAAQWLNKVSSVRPELYLLAPETSPVVLENVQNALLNDLQLRCRYQAVRSNQFREYTLNPLALVQRGQITYLVAMAEPYTDIRLFSLHRFDCAETLHDACRKAEGFNLKDYIASGALQFGTPQQIQLQAWVTDDLAKLLRETPLSADMQLIPHDDGALLTATVTHSWELTWWLLAQSGSIEIRQPKSLREELLQSLQKALQLHSR